jgi:hypothetical protein
MVGDPPFLPEQFQHLLDAQTTSNAIPAASR